MPFVVLIGIAQDGGVPQAGCSCSRCISVLESKSPELFPVALGLEDGDGNFHLIEASRTIAKQLYLWAQSSRRCNECSIISPIQSVTLTHLHLGHIDGLGQFGREVMGQKDVRLNASREAIDALSRRGPVLDPFQPIAIENNSGGKNESFRSVSLGKDVVLEFHKVPHRDDEEGDTHAIVIRGRNKSILFLPDHDKWELTLKLYNMDSIRLWLKSLSVNIALIDGTFWSYEEISTNGNKRDFHDIPHPPISQTLELLGEKQTEDPEIFFIHLNHSNPVINDPIYRSKIESLGWRVGEQGMVWTI